LIPVGLKTKFILRLHILTTLNEILWR